MEMPNIEYTGDISKFITTEDDMYNNIMYYKDNDFFMDSINYSKFIKGCERLVRTSKDYSKFVSVIKNEFGIDYCQVSPKIHDVDTQIEMHHGPLFTLYDICEVITNYFLMSNFKVNSFRIANQVMQEHWDLRVQVIMLSTTNHEAVHNRDIFINYNQAIGDIDSFIKRYTPYLSDEQKYKIWNYFNLCNNNPAFAKSFDRGILDLDYVKKYIKL